ncbi:MAG: class I SAM-dependent methyltransferase [Candidatus Nanohalobium sp.]
MTERPEEFYSKGAEQFAEKYSIENMPQAYIDLLDKFAEKVGGGKVLDAGCGAGRDTEYLTEKGLKATGIDLAEGMIEHARENKKGEYRLMDVRNLDFEENKFEGVWCNTLIHFFPPEEMPEIIDELKRVLKPEGVPYISFKIGEGTFIRERYGSEVKQYLIPEEKARNMLKERGLEIEEVNRAEVANTTIMNFLTEARE